MKKRPSHRLWKHFSSKCCAKNTQTAAALKAVRTALMQSNIVVIYQIFIGKCPVQLEILRREVALAGLVSGPSRVPAMVNCRDGRPELILELSLELIRSGF